jgi:hypothetical protein
MILKEPGNGEGGNNVEAWQQFLQKVECATKKTYDTTK